jgi:RNA polymerase sigma factor FliA
LISSSLGQYMPLSTDQLQKAWVDFKVYKDPNARVELINHYAYLVKITAGRLVTSLPGGIDREDLISAGVIGLIKSVDQFDPTRDVKFETYAIALIRGAILEMLREEDWVPRSIREKLKALDRASMSLETRFGRPASEQELADELGITSREVNELMVRMTRTNVYSLDDILGSSEGDDSIHFVELIIDENANTSGEVEGRELRRILASGIDHLPERERLVISLYYHEGLTFKEIGKVMTVSESRVYQLHTQAMTRLRTYMRSETGVSVA